MEILNRAIDLQNFFERLRHAGQRLLMLDYDGTLAPFCRNRAEAVPYDGIESLLDALIATRACRVVLISGRWSRDLLALLRVKHTPEIWGSHGWERRMPDGTYAAIAVPETPLRGLACLEDWLRDERLFHLCELKPACIAIHWRGRRDCDAAALKEQVAAQLALVPGGHTLYLADFDGGIEIRVRGRTKGDAVNLLMKECGSGALAAYCGDDATDEDAFAALGDRGLRVLVREVPRVTCADIRIVPPDELRWLLKTWLRQCQAQGCAERLPGHGSSNTC